MKSPVSYLKDAEFSNLPVLERTLLTSSSYLGQKEVGTNWGPFVKLTLFMSGIGVPAPWCAAFVTRCLLEAGWDKKLLPTYKASTYYWYTWAKAKGILLQPTEKQVRAGAVKRGMLFVWNGKDGGHIGFITAVKKDGTFVTIEGNTNSAGSREGDRVAKKDRSIELLQKFPRWGIIDLAQLLEKK